MGAVIQWHTVFICLWCVVFVTSQFDVIFMFPNQCLGEVSWRNTHILRLCVIALNINYQRSRLGYRRKTSSMLRHRSSGFSGFFLSKKAKGVNKRQNFKIWFQKSQIGYPATQKWECAWSTQENFQVFVMYRSPEYLVFLFPCWDIMKCVNVSTLTTAVFELVQQFYHATEFGNVANTVSACADQP